MPRGSVAVGPGRNGSAGASLLGIESGSIVCSPEGGLLDAGSLGSTCGSRHTRGHDIGGSPAPPLSCTRLPLPKLPSSGSERASSDVIRDSNGFYVCSECARAFGKLAGLSLHRRRQHFAEYNAGISTQRVKPRWSEEEEHMLARKEAELTSTGVSFLNQGLHEVFPDRSYDSIKSHRKAKSYRELVDSYKRLLGIGTLSQTSISTISSSADPLEDARGMVQIPAGSVGADPSEDVTGLPDYTTSNTSIHTPASTRPRRHVAPGCLADIPESPESPGDSSGESSEEDGGRDSSWLPENTSSGSDDASPISLLRALDVCGEITPCGTSVPLSPVGVLSDVIAASAAPSGVDTGSTDSNERDGRMAYRDSRLQIMETLARLVSSAPPRSFHAQELWNIAKRACRGGEFGFDLNNYIRSALFVDEVQSRSRLGPQHRRPESRRRRKRREYAEMQERFKKHQCECAREVLDGRPSIDITDSRGFLTHWKKIMEGRSPQPMPAIQPQRLGNVDLFFVATAWDIKHSFPPLRSAPGPDGFTSRKLRSIPMVVLQVLINLLMLSRRVPTCWKGARTVFIPKKERATEPGDFRPISIASVFLRLFHKILASRLSGALELDFRQRAFLPVDGCAENVMVLATALDEAKTHMRPLYMATLDIAKAFDRVSTDAIIRAAAIAGMSTPFLEYLQDLYTTSYTALTFGQTSLLARPSRGVRQGDPLSPLLFNTVVNEWLSSLTPDIAFRSGDLKVDAMAFADDVVLLASTRIGLQKRLDEFN